MPGIPSGNVSSNWKKLQAQLQADKKPDDSSSKKSNGNNTGTSTKRKRPVEKPTYLPPRHTKSTLNAAKKRKMGTSTSTTSSPPTTKPHSTLLTTHDIPAADLTAAYGTSHSKPTQNAHSTSSPSDIINNGLHPTHRAGKFLALDCEMVGHGPPPHSDDLLARVSVVNFHGEQIYDSFVQPPPGAAVKDYRTHVSGVTPWHLRPEYARPFAEVQSAIADLLRDKILIGHALKKDMQALQLTHPRRDVRDTSRYAPFRVESKGKPPALRNLARSVLGLTIQVGEHSSVEDARATMALFRREKGGFEMENRKVYGTKRRVENAKGKGSREESEDVESGSEDEDEEDEDDLELLEGEEEEDEENEEDEYQAILNGGEAAGKKKKKAAPDKKRKKKKKSRTKRK